MYLLKLWAAVALRFGYFRFDSCSAEKMRFFCENSNSLIYRRLAFAAPDFGNFSGSVQVVLLERST